MTTVLITGSEGQLGQCFIKRFLALNYKVIAFDIKNSTYKNDLLPIDINCSCVTCSNYSKSYLHHLFKSNELLGYQLLSIHNINFINSLMLYIRKAINNDNLEEAENEWYTNN